MTAAEAGGLVALALLALALGVALWFAWPRLPAKWRLGLVATAAIILAGAVALIPSRSKKRPATPPERDVTAEREAARAAVTDAADARREDSSSDAQDAREGVERAAAADEDTDESLAGRMGRLRPRGEKDDE